MVRRDLKRTGKPVDNGLMLVRRILVSALALWWLFNGAAMFRCDSVKFDGRVTECFDTPAGTVDGGYFAGWQAGLVVLALALTILIWMWIVPKVKLERARRVAGKEAETTSA
jgi:hypothetical protein